MPLDWSPLWLSLRYAGLATAFAALVALPLAWLLTHRHFPAREMLAAFADLPLLLPPAVLVYYLLAEPWALVRCALAGTPPSLFPRSTPCRSSCE